MENNKIDFNSFVDKDWQELGGEIKKYLPPSYPKKAEEVRIYKRRDGEFGADMTFISRTTGSFRVVRLHQTGASVFVNGCPIGRNDESAKNIEKVWKKFKNEKLKSLDERVL